MVGPETCRQHRGVGGGQVPHRCSTRAPRACARSCRRFPTARRWAGRTSPVAQFARQPEHPGGFAELGGELGPERVVADADRAMQRGLPPAPRPGSRRASASGSSVSAPRKASSQPSTSTTTSNERSTAGPGRRLLVGGVVGGKEHRVRALLQRCPHRACRSARRTPAPHRTRWRPPTRWVGSPAPPTTTGSPSSSGCRSSSTAAMNWSMSTCNTHTASSVDAAPTVGAGSPPKVLQRDRAGLQGERAGRGQEGVVFLRRADGDPDPTRGVRERSDDDLVLLCVRGELAARSRSGSQTKFACDSAPRTESPQGSRHPLPFRDHLMPPRCEFVLRGQRGERRGLAPES